MLNKKFYIKRYVVNNYNSFSEFIKENNIDTSKIEGYLLYTDIYSKSVLVDKPIVFNIYFLRDASNNTTPEKIEADWNLVKSETKDKAFVNPSLEIWLNTKDNWCKQLANKLSLEFSRPFNDMLSELYLSILNCYNKGTIYMGNLNYIKKAVYNNILMDLRFNKKRLNGINENVVSLDIPLGVNSDGDEILFSDIIEAPNEASEESLEYTNLVENIRKLLSKTFSPREIDQILSFRTTSNTSNSGLYRRFLTWKKNHSVEDLYD